MTEDSFSPEDRIPCSDDMCVGVIGENGSCGVCAKTYEGDEPLPKPEQVAETKPSQSPAESTENNEPAPMDPDERVCCPDDMCVGIIGDNDSCGVCGKTL